MFLAEDLLLAKAQIYMLFLGLALTGVLIAKSWLLFSPAVMAVAMLFSNFFGWCYKGPDGIGVAKEYAKIVLVLFLVGFSPIIIYGAIDFNDIILIILSVIFCLPVIFSCSYFMFRFGYERKKKQSKL